MLTIPSQFHCRFGTVPGTGAGAGPAAAAGGGYDTAGTGAGWTDGGAAGCAEGCLLPRGFPQFLQNWVVSGFCAPHSPQNIPALLPGGNAGHTRARGRRYRSPGFFTAGPCCTGVHNVLSPTPTPVASRCLQVCRLISPTNILLIFWLPIASHASGLLFLTATSLRQSIFR